MPASWTWNRELQTRDGPDFLIRASGVPTSQPRPDLATLNFEAMNAVAADTGQPVLGPPMSAEEAEAISLTA